MATKYDLMDDNTYYQDDFGNYYSDPLTYPLLDFTYEIEPQERILSQVDIDRFDLFIYSVYGNVNYEYFILRFNNIEYISRMEPGDTILLPSSIDIENFIREYSK